MRLRLKCGWILAAIILLAAFASAEPVASLKPSDCVNDFAGVLSPAVITQLKEMCRQVLDKAQASLVVVTIKSTDGEEIFPYSVDLYQKWGIGQKGKDRGVLILLAVQDRKYYINVGYGLEGILPDGKVGGFGREAVPYLKRNDYDGAVSLLTSRVADVIAKYAGVDLTTSQPRRIEPLAGLSPHDRELSPATIVGLIVLVILVLAVPPLAVLDVFVRRRRRPRRIQRRWMGRRRGLRRWRRWVRRFRRRQHGRWRRRRQLVVARIERSLWLFKLQFRKSRSANLSAGCKRRAARISKASSCMAPPSQAITKPTIPT